MFPNEEKKKMQQPSSMNAKRRRNEALKTVNSRVRPERPQLSQQLDSTTTTTSRSLTKPRQLLVQPKIVQKGNVYFSDNERSTLYPFRKILF